MTLYLPKKGRLYRNKIGLFRLIIGFHFISWGIEVPILIGIMYVINLGLLINANYFFNPSDAKISLDFLQANLIGIVVSVLFYRFLIPSCLYWAIKELKITILSEDEFNKRTESFGYIINFKNRKKYFKKRFGLLRTRDYIISNGLMIGAGIIYFLEAYKDQNIASFVNNNIATIMIITMIAWVTLIILIPFREVEKRAQQIFDYFQIKPDESPLASLY